MTELEKVIDDLGRVMACGQTMLDCGTESPMVFKMIRDAADNAIIFLKAQEPRDAIVVPNGIDKSGGWWFQCPSCKMEIEPRDRYCRSCGQAVKWE